MRAYNSFLLSILIVMISSSNTKGTGPPSPGHNPSTKFHSLGFNESFRQLWGPPDHQKLEHGALKIWLDKSSGSGFKSIDQYRSGYFSASIKLHPGYTAGILTTFYLSNEEGEGNRIRDEIDMEFIGRRPEKPYTLHTNIKVKGSVDKNQNSIGREVQFHLWFDPTQDFHNYAILWTPNEIIFLVDDVPIRRYPKKKNAPFPEGPMWVVGSIWDASKQPWATEEGKYVADYKHEPFIGWYRDFKITGCSVNAPPSCSPPSVGPPPSGSLSPQQFAAMEWVQKNKNYMSYDYCTDPNRDRALKPEC